MKDKIVHTFCGICGAACAHIATVENGKLVKVRADIKSGYRHAICPTGKGPITNIGVENHPDRLKYPLKRIGNRGEGKWERISWDDALDIVAGKLLELKEKHGPESVAICLGEPKNMETIFAHRFATTFGTPNVTTPGGLCGVVRVWASRYTYGRPTIPDYPERYEERETWPLPRLFIEWGNDSVPHAHRHATKVYQDTGVKIVVIDPRKTKTASRAYRWIRVRPGGDGALAMGMLKVILEEELYDKDFVSKWTVGIEKIREEVRKFNLDEVEQISWVPKNQVIELARLYATTKPAIIEDGNAIECMKNGFQIFRILCILRSITGNLNVPGGETFLTPGIRIRPGRMMLLSKIGRDFDKAIGKEFNLAMKAAFVPWQSIVKANIEGDPYLVRAAICCLTNPVVSYPDSKATHDAFMRMELITVLDLFHTPTTAIADIVLPAAWTWEEDTIGYWGGWYEEYRGYSQVVPAPGEAWPDAKIFNELAKRVGLGHHFWNDHNEALDEFMQGTGLTFKDLLNKRKILPTREYKGPEEVPYNTASGKVEIYSRSLEEEGYDPLPTWEVVSRLPGELTQSYPFLMTNAKSDVYMLSAFKMIGELRKKEPEAFVHMNPEAARKLDLQEGDLVFIETRKGRITQRLVYDSELDERVIIAAFGWWYPEDGPRTLYGLMKSNVNILTGYEDPGQPVGVPDLRGIPCRVYKAS